jgi:Asp/Glu/hydantoin racemase
VTEETQKVVYVLHTSFSLVEVLGKLFAKDLSGIRIVNIVDDSTLADVRTAGKLTPAVARRLVGYALLAESAGADAVFNTCSSVGDAADLMRQVVDIPVIKIDDPMTGEAVQHGKGVALIATVPTTLDPTARLVQSKADQAGVEVEIRHHLVSGAFDVLMAGDAEKHDRMVSAEIERASQQADVTVLAQASMARLVPRLADRLPVPLLSSLASGVAQLKRL